MEFPLTESNKDPSEKSEVVIAKLLPLIAKESVYSPELNTTVVFNMPTCKL